MRLVGGGEFIRFPPPGELILLGKANNEKLMQNYRAFVLYKNVFYILYILYIYIYNCILEVFMSVHCTMHIDILSYEGFVCTLHTICISNVNVLP